MVHPQTVTKQTLEGVARNCQMMYKANALVIVDEQHRRNIVHDVQQGVGDNAKALASSSYLERTSIYQKITSFL